MAIKTKPPARRRKRKRHIPFRKKEDWTQEADAFYNKINGIEVPVTPRKEEDWTYQVARHEKKIDRLLGESDQWSWSIEMNERFIEKKVCPKNSEI